MAAAFPAAFFSSNKFFLRLIHGFNWRRAICSKAPFRE